MMGQKCVFTSKKKVTVDPTYHILFESKDVSRCLLLIVMAIWKNILASVMNQNNNNTKEYDSSSYLALRQSIYIIHSYHYRVHGSTTIKLFYW